MSSDPIEDLESLLGDYRQNPKPIDDLEHLLSERRLSSSSHSSDEGSLRHLKNLEELVSNYRSDETSPPSSQSSDFGGDDFSYEETRSLPRDVSEVHEDALATNVGAEWQRPSSYDAMESASELS